MNNFLVYPGSVMIYFLILIVTTILSYLFRYSDDKVKKIFLFMIIVVLSFFSGIRYDTVGTDTKAYVEIIESCRKSFFGVPDTYSEPCFILLIKIILLFCDNPYFVLFVIALITNALIVMRFWDLKEKISFSFAIFAYGTLYYHATLSGIRQWLSVAIVFFATKYVFKKKYFLYSFFVFIATLFHTSALISLIYVFFDYIVSEKRKKTKNQNFLFFGTMMFVVVVIFWVLSKESTLLLKYNHLLSDKYRNFNPGFSVLIKFIIIAFSFLFIKEKDYYNYDKEFRNKVYLYYLLSNLIMVSGYFYKNIFRIGWYFSLYEVVFFSFALKKTPKLLFLKIAFVILLLYLFFRGINGSSVGQMPYITIFG